MNIKELIKEQLCKGMSLGRLANVLEISYQGLSNHKEGVAKSVNLKLAKTVYKKFNVVLDGFIEIELKE